MFPITKRLLIVEALAQCIIGPSFIPNSTNPLHLLSGSERNGNFCFPVWYNLECLAIAILGHFRINTQDVRCTLLLFRPFELSYFCAQGLTLALNDRANICVLRRENFGRISPMRGGHAGVEKRMPSPIPLHGRWYTVSSQVYLTGQALESR